MSGFEVTGADPARWLVADQLREVAALLGLGTGPLDGTRAALFVRGFERPRRLQSDAMKERGLRSS